MKENELIQMRNKIESLTRLMDFTLNELNHIKTLSSGTFQTLREMKGYDAAVKKLTDKYKEQEQKDKVIN
jgi:hypothetical protein